MRPKSIRWRLTLSYAAIALLAASALGVVLLTTLRGYYQQREQEYLLSNAQRVTLKFAETIKAGEPLDVQAQGLAFLLQARVRVLGVDKQVLADSGLPDKLGVAVGAGKFTKALSNADDLKAADRFTIIAIRAKPGLITDTLPVPVPPAGLSGMSVPVPPDMPDGMTGQFFIGSQDVLTGTTVYYASMKVAGTPLGFEVNNETVDRSGGRSDRVVDQPLYDTTGTLRGYVELSDGPAYGQEIVNSVAGGWAIASVIAIMLAAAAGWLFSRRLSKPIVALTDVTARMAEGDLSTRANMVRDDETGTLARSFNEMADRVEATVATLRRFVGDAAHELHTPLTALRTDLELVADTDDPAARLDLLDRAQAQVTRLATLTSGLLDLSRIEAEAARPKRQPIDLAGLVQELSEVYASRAEQAGIAFSLDAPDGPVTVQGNEEQLRRALGNLLDNAIKFTPAGGQVGVALRRADTAIELQVEDSGIGVPEDDLPQLFGRFHRGRNASTYPGNGLGLAIVRAIVETHGGSVTAENLAQGARFSLRLPVG
jgi:signal transduction histidine kinase